MIIKIEVRKIEHQPNIKMFVWECNNLIESKLQQIIKSNFESTQNNSPNTWFESLIPLDLITLIFYEIIFYLVIQKISARKIEHQPNIMAFVWDNDKQ